MVVWFWWIGSGVVGWIGGGVIMVDWWWCDYGGSAVVW